MRPEKKRTGPPYDEGQSGSLLCKDEIKSDTFIGIHSLLRLFKTTAKIMPAIMQRIPTTIKTNPIIETGLLFAKPDCA